MGDILSNFRLDYLQTPFIGPTRGRLHDVSNFAAAQTTGANIPFLDLARNQDVLALQVHVPASLGAAMRVAQLKTNTRSTFTNTTNSRHNSLQIRDGEVLY